MHFDHMVQNDSGNKLIKKASMQGCLAASLADTEGVTQSIRNSCLDWPKNKLT